MMRRDEIEAMVRAQDESAPPPPPAGFATPTPFVPPAPPPPRTMSVAEGIEIPLLPAEGAVPDADREARFRAAFGPAGGAPRPSGVAAAVARAREAREARVRAQAQGAGGAARRRAPARIEGDDAVLLVGKHSGRRVSDLARTAEGRGYLEWILDKDFPDDLKDIVRNALETNEERDPFAIPPNYEISDDDVPW